MKKTLRWALIGIGALVFLPIVALLIAGRREGAGSNRAVVHIAKTPQAVFPFFVDLNVFKTWVDWTEVSLDSPGALRVGSKFHVVVINEGSRVDMEGAVAVLEPNRLIGWVLQSNKPPFLFTENAVFTLNETGEGVTRVEMLTDTKYEGVLALFEPLISHAAQKRLEADLARLKALAEK